jgi:hypothetical protein
LTVRGRLGKSNFRLLQNARVLRGNGDRIRRSRSCSRAAREQLTRRGGRAAKGKRPEAVTTKNEDRHKEILKGSVRERQPAHQ